jgi:hypothetical protein
MRDNNKTPNAPRCINCARPMQLLRKTSRFGGLADLFSFYCVTCDEWHVGRCAAKSAGPPESLLESLSDAHEFSWRELRRAILPTAVENRIVGRGTKKPGRLGTGCGEVSKGRSQAPRVAPEGALG